MSQENGSVKSDSQVELFATNQFEPIEIQVNAEIVTLGVNDILDSDVQQKYLKYYKREKPEADLPDVSKPLFGNDLKDYLGFLSATRNFPKYWTIESVNSLEKLISIIDQGWAYRGGIKIGGNSKTDIRDTQILSLDFDNGQYTGTTERDEFFLDYACLWYKTPSYTPENNKHRVIFILDRPTTSTEYELIYQCVMRERYPHADKTKDAGRLFYGARGTKFVHKFGDGLKRLPVDKYLKLASEAKQFSEQEYEKTRQPIHGKKATNNGKGTGAKPVITNPVTELSDDIPIAQEERGDVTEQVLAHLYEHLFQGVYKGDAGKLYSLHDPGQVWKTREPEEGEIRRIAGSNPFSPSDSNGDSLMVVEIEGKLPRFWDKSQNLGRILMREKGAESCHGTYFDYYFYCQKLVGNYADIEYQEDGSFPKGFFVKLVKDICKQWRLPQFEFRANKWMAALTETANAFEGKVYVEGWMSANNDVMFAVWDEELKYYFHQSLEYFSSYVFTPFFEKRYPNYQEMFQDWCVETNKRTPPMMAGVIQRQVKARFKKVLKLYPKTARQQVPYQNGVFDLKSQQLEDYESSNYVSFAPALSYNYYPVEDTHPVIQNLLTYFTDWMNCPIKGQLLLSYLVLCVQREAYRLRHMVVLMGKKKMGKSTYGQLVVGTLRGSHPESRFGNCTSASEFLNHDKFSNSILEDAYVLYLEEMNTFNRYGANYEKLKNFINIENIRTVPIENKHEKARKVEVFTAFIGGCEDMLKLTTSDGLDDRMVYVKIDESLNMGLKDRITELEKNPEVIHNWCMTQDSDYWLAQFREVCQNSVFKEALIEKKRESEPLVDFIENCFELTDNPEDLVPASTIWDTFRDYRDREKMNRDYSSSIAFGIAFTRILEQEKYGFNWRGTKAPKGVRTGGTRKCQIHYSHLRLLSANSEDPSTGF